MSTMPRHQLTAILPCNDVARSRDFYARLGFTEADGDKNYLMLSDGKGAAVHLRAAETAWLFPDHNPFGVYFYCDNVDELAERFHGEVLAAGKPEDKPWGMYEFALSDPDGTLVRIGRRIPQ